MPQQEVAATPSEETEEPERYNHPVRSWFATPSW
jgi:hypothetical protein